MEQLEDGLTGKAFTEAELAQLVEAAIENDEPSALGALLHIGADPTGVAGAWLRSYANPDWSHLHHAIDVEIDAAAQAGVPPDLRLVRLLVEAGADTAAQNESGEFPIDMARRRGHDAAVRLLERIGRDRYG
jgi:ankyrin repeat protein